MSIRALLVVFAAACGSPPDLPPTGPGWPQSLAPYAITGHTVTFDLYGGSEREVFAIGETAGGGALYVWDHDGTPAFAMPLDGPNTGAPAFADLDGVGGVDIVVNGAHKIYAFDASGNPLAGWGGIPIPSTPPCMGSPPSVVDTSPVVTNSVTGNVLTTAVDDGCGNDAHVYVWQYDGMPLATYDFVGRGHVAIAPAIADIDGDYVPDAVIAATATDLSSAALYLINMASRPYVQLPPAPIVVVPGAAFESEPVIADLDADGILDVVVADSGGDLLRAVHINSGLPVAGWTGGRPIEAGDHLVRSGGRSSTLAVADVDCDRKLEIALGTEQRAYVFEHDGGTKDGWPVVRTNLPGTAASSASPLIVDANGDGRLDVVLGSSPPGGGGLIQAWDIRAGLPLPGFPQMFPDPIARTGTIADVDGDGMLDLVQGAGQTMHARALAGQSVPARMPWTTIAHDALHRSAQLVTTSGLQCCVPRAVETAAWWTFNDSDVAGLDRIGTNHGALVGAVTQSGGVVGGGFDFSGGHVAVVDNTALALGGSFTIDFWMKRHFFEGGGTIVRKGLLLAGDDVQLSGPGFHLYHSLGQFEIAVDNSSPSVLNPNTPWSDPWQTWTFVAVTVDVPNQLVSLYLDGVHIETTTLPPGTLTNSHPLIIGGSDVAPTSNRSYLGGLDELSLVNRVLDASEIQEIYRAGGSGTCGSVECLGARTMVGGNALGYSVVGPDETGGVHACQAGFGHPDALGLAFTPWGAGPLINTACSVPLFVFDQAGTTRQSLGPTDDIPDLSCASILADSGVFPLGGPPVERRETDFVMPEFPGLLVHLRQDASAGGLEQTYTFTNLTAAPYLLRIARVADLDIPYAPDGSFDLGGYQANESGFLPDGAEVHDVAMTVRVAITASSFEGARRQGDGGSALARTWENYGVPTGELNVYGRDGVYENTSWTGDPVTPMLAGPADQAVVVQSLLTVPAGGTATYVTNASSL